MNLSFYDIDFFNIDIDIVKLRKLKTLNYEGNDDYEADFRLYDRLAKMGHWSPFEHVARVMTEKEYHFNVRGKGVPNYELGISSSNPVLHFDKKELGWSGNFKGFIQHRKEFKNENKEDGRVIKR